MSCGDSGKQIHKYKESCHYSVVVNSFACGFEGPVFETPHGQLSYNWQHAIAINSATWTSLKHLSHQQPAEQSQCLGRGDCTLYIA